MKTKKTLQNSRKQRQDPENPAEKNNDGNSNLPPTEDKTDFNLNSVFGFELFSLFLKVKLPKFLQMKDKNMSNFHTALRTILLSEHWPFKKQNGLRR